MSTCSFNTINLVHTQNLFVLDSIVSSANFSIELSTLTNYVVHARSTNPGFQK